MERIALKAASLMPSLLLQKPHKLSKAKDHSRCLERRLYAWKEGDIADLILECRVIQQHLDQPKIRQDDQGARSFARLMFEGKTRAALRMLSSNNSSNSLPLHTRVHPDDPLSPTVLDELKAKHPAARPVLPEALLPPAADESRQLFHVTLFESSDAVPGSCGAIGS